MGAKLKAGEAFKSHQAFLKKLANSGATNLPDFPNAVCVPLDELKKLIADVEKSLANNGVPSKEMGVAIVPGINLSNKPHSKSNVTFMLVATKFTEDDTQGKVITISNPVTGSHQISAKKKITEDPPIDDNSFDVWGQWP
jgi:hypothetical protein